MSKKGGYKIVDFKGVVRRPYPTKVPDGTYEKLIDASEKAVLISGLDGLDDFFTVVHVEENLVSFATSDFKYIVTSSNQLTFTSFPPKEINFHRHFTGTLTIKKTITAGEAVHLNNKTISGTVSTTTGTNAIIQVNNVVIPDEYPNLIVQSFYIRPGQYGVVVNAVVVNIGNTDYTTEESYINATIDGEYYELSIA